MFGNAPFDKMKIFIVDLKCIMNMAIYDIVGEVAEPDSVLK